MNDVVKVVLETESSLLSEDQLAGYLVTAICVLINVIVAYIIIRLFVFKPLFKMVANRQDKLNGELDDAIKKGTEVEQYKYIGLRK